MARFDYDAAHNGPNPPHRLIVGVLREDPGSYEIRFVTTDDKPIADWIAVVVNADRRGIVRDPITQCTVAGRHPAFLMVEWKGAKTGEDGPRTVSIDCG